MVNRFERAQSQRDDFSTNRRRALTACWRMIFSGLPAPAEASRQKTARATGVARAGTRYPPRIRCGAGFFGIMRVARRWGLAATLAATAALTAQIGRASCRERV